ncbi:hypothetical protein L3i22_090550 [Actinoplanes sp. L3-i22]|nr:hypothetical protein L3i22_090550 [Actinoplanes sp. L3-i22]
MMYGHSPVNRNTHGSRIPTSGETRQTTPSRRVLGGSRRILGEPAEDRAADVEAVRQHHIRG